MPEIVTCWVLIVTPEDGFVIVIFFVTVKVGVWGAVPLVVFKTTGPVVARKGTVASTSEVFTWVKVADTPLMVTEEVPFRLSPWIRTVEPERPDEGLSRMICGSPV